jgi:hypothetical protein
MEKVAIFTELDLFLRRINQFLACGIQRQVAIVPIASRQGACNASSVMIKCIGIVAGWKSYEWLRCCRIARMAEDDDFRQSRVGAP